MTDSPSLRPDMDTLLSYLVPPSQPGQHRLFHGRGNAVPGWEWLTVDRFAPVLVLTFFAEHPQQPQVIEALTARMPLLDCEALVVQRRYGGNAHNDVVAGVLPDTVWAHEQGLRFQLDFERGQNIGFFTDMVPARAWLAERAQGKRVLNLFAFTCAFSVVALAAGAEQVVNIDLSRPALSQGQRNHEANQLDGRRAHFLPHDIFRSWKKLHSLGRYDLIIIDPPSDQKGSFVARKDYARVLRQLHRLLAPQAELLVCLNAPWLDQTFLETLVQENLRGCELASRLPFAPGFMEKDPQAGLKVLHYRYQRPDDL